MIDSVPRPTGADENVTHKSLTARVPAELLDEIKAIAQREERSLNYITIRLLRRGLEAERDAD